MSQPILVTRILQYINWKCEVQYCQSESENHAILIPPYPDTGATMNNKIISLMFELFIQRGWNVMRFNFSELAKAKGHMQCLVELNYLTDWYIKNIMINRQNFLLCGYASGAAMTIEMLMRRPECNGFVSLAFHGPAANSTFLAPCTHPGLFVHGKYDKIAPLDKAQEIVKRLQSAQNKISMQILEDDHFFTKHRYDLLKDILNEYIDEMEESKLEEPEVEYPPENEHDEEYHETDEHDAN